MRVSSKNQSIKRSGRRAAFKRHSNTDPVDDGGQPGLLQPAVVGIHVLCILFKCL